MKDYQSARKDLSKLTKRQCVAFAIKAAELVIKIWSEKYPDDTRPQRAIQAAKDWLNNPSINADADADAAATAANAAAAADAAYTAAYAAGNAAYAYTAAYAAGNAAYAAAYAAYAAYSAAADAAYTATAAADANIWDKLTEIYDFISTKLDCDNCDIKGLKQDIVDMQNLSLIPLLGDLLEDNNYKDQKVLQQLRSRPDLWCIESSIFQS